MTLFLPKPHNDGCHVQSKQPLAFEALPLPDSGRSVSKGFLASAVLSHPPHVPWGAGAGWNVGSSLGPQPRAQDLSSAVHPRAPLLPLSGCGPLRSQDLTWTVLSSCYYSTRGRQSPGAEWRGCGDHCEEEGEGQRGGDPHLEQLLFSSVHWASSRVGLKREKGIRGIKKC